MFSFLPKVRERKGQEQVLGARLGSLTHSSFCSLNHTHLDASQLQSYNTIVPLFKLTKGCATASDGLSCAVLAGLPLIVVRRAE